MEEPVHSKGFNMRTVMPIALLLILSSGCGEIWHSRYYKFKEPDPNNRWIISTSKGYFHEKHYAAESRIDNHAFRVTIGPRKDDSLSCGPVLPIFPNFFIFFEGAHSKDVIEVNISISPPPPKYDFESIYIKINDKVYSSWAVQSQIPEKYKNKWADYGVLFYIDETDCGIIEIFFPDFGLSSNPEKLECQLVDETEYRLLPPRGCFQ